MAEGYCGYSQPTLCGASAVRSRRTGAAVRGYSRGYSAVRAHRYVCDGRADDADVAGAAVGDTHEPAVAFGLHTPRRAQLAAAPALRFAGDTPLRCEYCAPRRSRRQGYCGYSQPTPCATARRISGAEPPDGSHGARVPKRVLGSARAPLCS